MYGLNNASVALHRALRKYLVQSASDLRRRPESASDLRRRRVTRTFISFFVNRAGQLAPWPHILAIFCVFGNWADQSPLKGRCFFGKKVWQDGGSGEDFRARGHGSSPGERFLGDADPGGLYAKPEVSSHIPAIAGRPERAVAGG